MSGTADGADPGSAPADRAPADGADPGSARAERAPAASASGTIDCLFCRIAAGSIPATIVHEDDQIMAFRDIAPRAPTHVLLIPRRHIDSALELTEADAPLLGRLFAVAADVARSEGVAAGGYRLVTNIGERGGQTVHHLHVHLLGGRSLGWPPG